MAFMDFMNRGIGGMTTPQTAPAVGDAWMGEGDVVTQPSRPIGPTYGDITRAAMQYGSSPGSSGPMLASMTRPRNPYGQSQLMPLAPNAPNAQKKLTGQPAEDDDSLGMIAKFFASLLGGGV